MTLLILSSLFLLTPVTGVVSGGRSTAFATLEGLLPADLWMYEPGIPTGKTGTFTEITFHGLNSESFRVVSSGETIGVHPLVASSVRNNGYAFQLTAGDFSLNCIEDAESGSHSLQYKNVTLDFRSSSSGSVNPAGEYSDRYFLLGITRHTSVFAGSFPVGEHLTIGPAYIRTRYSGNFWVRGMATIGPLSVVSVPAIDEESIFRRLFGTLKYKRALMLYGWDGEEQFASLSCRGNEFTAEVSMFSPGVMVEYRLAERLLLLFSHRNGGWLQGEIQGGLHGITAGVDMIRHPGGSFSWGLSFGIELGNKNIRSDSLRNTSWFSANAVNSFQY